MKISELRIICQKEKLQRNTGLTLFNRKISIYVTWLFIRFQISANQTSVCGIVLGIAGSMLFIPGNGALNLVGVAILYISFLFDQVDGELARYYKTVNLNGVYIDEIRHLIIYSITIFCLSFPAAEQFSSNIPFFLGFIGAISLTIARVEERLPYQIFTEKVILKDNFTGGRLHSNEVEKNEVNENNWSDSRSVLRKKMATLFYGLHHFITHQVYILIWLMMGTLVDHYICKDVQLIESISSQSIFFLVFVFVNFVTLVKVIIGNFQVNKVENLCREMTIKIS